ncbi:MAG: nucleoside phosphorylase [Ruminococcus sp.]|nr:nucleoside phosphorylase [Ruminococcus sp.]
MASIMDSERQFHIKTLPDEVGRYVILTGDPGRVPVIAELLDNAEQVAYNREYNVYTGYLLGKKVTVCSTGIGGPSSAIAVEELVKCGADTFIRVGTSGGMDLKVSGGDLVIASAAVRGEGTSFEYLTPDYPAVADFTVVNALAKACEKCCDDKIGNRYHVGVVHSKDSFYGEVEPDNSPVRENIKSRWESYIRCGCLTSEMECSAIFSVGLARGVRCSAILTALWNVERSKAGLEDNITYDSTKAINCAIDAIKLLIENDKL